jgi:LysM repeat protein
MNAFIFVRSEKSYANLSQLIYGDAVYADTLAQWNGGKSLEPGTLIYYNSPFRPEDNNQMLSFESDFGLTLDSVTVQSGDTLSGIAMTRYGSVASWREIASLNQARLTSPDLIEVGQTLQLGNYDRNTLPVLQSFVEQARREAEEAAALSVQEEQVAQVEEVEQFDNAVSDPSEGMAAQAPPEDLESEMAQESEAFDDGIEDNVADSQAPPAEAEAPVEEAEDKGLAWIDYLVMVDALFAVAGAAVYYTRKKKGAEPLKASDILSFVKKKTGTDD